MHVSLRPVRGSLEEPLHKVQKEKDRNGLDDRRRSRYFAKAIEDSTNGDRYRHLYTGRWSIEPEVRVEEHVET